MASAGSCSLVTARPNDNVEPLRFQGFRDTPLNATGRAQAHALAARIADEGTIRSIWASDLSRARETAETVGNALGLPVTLRRPLA